MATWDEGALEANDKVTRTAWALSEDQEQFLLDNWRLLSDDALAEMLGTTKDAVRKLRVRRGLARRGKKVPPPTKAEVPIILWVLRDNYEDLDKTKNEIKLKLGELDGKYT